MSTKIFNGYTLGNMNLLELHEFTQKVRERMSSEYKDLYKQLLADKIVEFVDKLFLQSAESVKEWYEDEFGQEFALNRSVEILLHCGVRDKVKQAKESQTRDFEYDLEASVVYIPLARKVLALFYGEKNEYHKVWESFPEVRDYAYWNNTDPDNNVSKREWNQRRKDWDKALPGIGIASENGFVVEFFSNPPRITPVLALPLLTSFEKRVKRNAKHAILNARMRYICENDKNIKIFSAFEAANEWFKTDEGQKVFQEEKERIAALIPKEITPELLAMKISELFENKEKFISTALPILPPKKRE